jgi:hypothetical protein
MRRCISSFYLVVALIAAHGAGGATHNIVTSKFSVGSVVKNGIDRHLTNPATTVFTSNSWGATGVRYLKADDPTQFIFSTVADERDVSVTTWGDDCIVFLRENGGRAWYFRYNYNTGTPTGRGILTIGVVPEWHVLQHL